MLINSAVLTTTLAGIAAAIPTNLARAGPHRDGGGGGGGGAENGGGSCNANALCCDNVGSAEQLQDLLGGLLGLNVDALTGNLGIGCIDLDVIGLLGDNSCNAQAVCCQGTTFSNVELIGLDCDPIDIL